MPNPKTNPRHVRLGGIAEGRATDGAALQKIVSGHNRRCRVRLDLEIDGPRFSLTFDQEWMRGNELTEGEKEDLVGTLQRVIEATGPESAIESTLSCAEVFEEEVTETMFGVREGELAVLTRQRPLQAEDAESPYDFEQVDATSAALMRLGTRRAALVLLALLILFGVTAWQGNYLGRVFSPAPSEVAVDVKALQGAVRAELDREWGNYRITLTRGDAYPSTVEAARAWEESAQTLEARALRQALTTGTTVHLRSRDAEGEILEVVAISLLELLEEDGKIEARIPGRLGTRSIEISVSGRG